MGSNPNRAIAFILELMPWEKISYVFFQINTTRQRYHTFTKCISPNVNVIEWLGFELAYFKAVTSNFSHCGTENSHPSAEGVINSKLFFLEDGFNNK